jgi:hypothetical protein
VPAVQKSEVLIIEASVKPFIGLIWTGAALMVAGLVISLAAKLNGKGRKRQTPDQRENHGDLGEVGRARDARKPMEELAEKREN